MHDGQLVSKRDNFEVQRGSRLGHEPKRMEQ